MSPSALQGIQSTFTLVLSALVARWWVWPALQRRPTNDALVPLFLVHALRYLPATAFAPGQVDARLPMDAMGTIAWGDTGAAVLALIAALFLRYRWTGAIAVAWLVNIVASLDWLYAGYVASSSHLATFPMGGNWYIMNVYAPILPVVHVMIFLRLLGTTAVVATASARAFPAQR